MNKKMKYVSLVIVMVLMVVLAAGCSKTEPEEEKSLASGETGDKATAETQETEKEAVKLNFWTWFPSAEEYRPLLDEFTAETGIEVELFVIGSTDYQKKLPLALTSGDNIDVIGVQPNMANQLTTFLEPLEPLLDEKTPGWQENYKEEDLRQSKQVTGGELYMLNAGSVGDWFIFYNADMIAELGLEVPTTFEEWGTFNQSIRQAKPDVIPFAYWGGVGHVYYQTAAVLSGQDSTYLNDIRYKAQPWNGEGFVKGIDHLLHMFDGQIMSYDEVADLDRGRALELFAQGKVASYMDGSWGATMLSEDYRTENGYSNDVGAFAFPVAQEGGQVSVRTFINNTVGIVNYSEHKDEAAQLLEFLAMGKGSTTFANRQNWFTSVKDYEVDYTPFVTEASKEGYDRILDAVANSRIDRNNPNAFPEKAGTIIVNAILKGDTDAQSVADELQKEWDTGMYE